MEVPRLTELHERNGCSMRLETAANHCLLQGEVCEDVVPRNGKAGSPTHTEDFRELG